MEAVLIKSVGFIFIIFIGYMLKKRGFFKREDGFLLSKIMMNITLPATLIAGTSGMKIDYIAIVIILIGIGSNLFNIYFSKFVNRKSSRVERAINMINCAGYNVGSFAIPFASSFFEPIALAYMCMFDIGNVFLVLGGSYALAKNEIDGDGRLNIKILIKTLLKSFPFDVYLFLFIISLLKISIPKEIISIAANIGAANGFIAMLMIGIMLEINISRKQIISVIKLLGVRYLGNIVLSLVVYFILPLPILAREMIIIILFAPLSAVAVVYSKMIDPDDPIPALANSISIIISICVMTGLLILFI